MKMKAQRTSVVSERDFVGLHPRAKALNSAFSIDEIFFKVPPNISRTAARSFGLIEGCEQWDLAFSVDIHLRHKWEGYLVLGLGEITDFIVCTRFLGTKLVAGEANYCEVFVCLVKRLERSILGR